jgi:hypothetical protein
MMKGPNAQNRTLVDYGSEGLTNPVKKLYVASNTMVSTRANGATFVAVAAGTDSARIINNIFAGVGTIWSGIADTVTNAYSSEIKKFFFLDTSKFDYHLFGDIIGFSPLFASNPRLAGSFSLTPTFEYVHRTDSVQRIDKYVGAVHNISESVMKKYLDDSHISNFPNPFSEKTTIDLGSIEDGSPVLINIFNQLGEKILAKNIVSENSQLIFERGNLAAGVYYYEIENTKGTRVATGKFVIL